MSSLSRQNPIGRMGPLRGLLGTALAVAGCQPGQTGQGSGDVAQTVSIQDLSFSPRDLTVRRGETIRWTNGDNFRHTVTSGQPGDADAGEVFDLEFDAGASAQRTFNELGTFTYFCRIHADDPDMVGATVTVNEAEAE